MRAPVVALLSDFGGRDGYVAEMHAVLLTQCPDLRILDISHEISPGDVASAAFILWRVSRRLPEGTIFVGVVDPGVGSERQSVAVRTCGRMYLAPDNGLLSRVIGETGDMTIRILRPEDAGASRVSATFHGRDLFTPVAARLALGEELESLGIAGRLVDTIRPSVPQRIPKGWKGEVVYLDRFGNMVTNLPSGLTGVLNLVNHGGMRRIQYYEQGGPGDLCYVAGSAGFLEIVINRGSAADMTGAAIGDGVTLLEA